MLKPWLNIGVSFASNCFDSKIPQKGPLSQRTSTRQADEKRRRLSRGVAIPALRVEVEGSLRAEKLFPRKFEFPVKIRSATGEEEQPGVVGAGRETRARLSSGGEFDCGKGLAGTAEESSKRERDRYGEEFEDGKEVEKRARKFFPICVWNWFHLRGV
ncbi:hypothetical protein L484_002106 [Morus notabilis]|uniref:Uncharacterized protein n=1 Tax=Morus notabilis TaxID=981085 RepID=W9QVQ3_9ROSA|nr:hypothetical protein L484_002106 [Morus notabilis]